MKNTNFEKLFNKIIIESKKFNKNHSIIKQDEDNNTEIDTGTEEAAPEDIIHQDEEETQNNQEEQENYEDQDQSIYDFSELNGVTEDQANQIVEQLKADDDVINNTLITIEQIFYKVADVNDEDEIPSNPKFQEFVEELKGYVSSEWGMEWDEMNDQQEMLFYTLAFLVNEKKELFASEEEWKKYYVLFEAEQQESQSIIYPTWQQGRGILDFFLQYFDANEYQDDEEQEVDSTEQNEE